MSRNRLNLLSHLGIFGDHVPFHWHFDKRLPRNVILLGQVKWTIDSIGYFVVPLSSDDLMYPLNNIWGSGQVIAKNWEINEDFMLDDRIQTYVHKRVVMVSIPLKHIWELVNLEVDNHLHKYIESYHSLFDPVGSLHYVRPMVVSYRFFLKKDVQIRIKSSVLMLIVSTLTNRHCTGPETIFLTSSCCIFAR